MKKLLLIMFLIVILSIAAFSKWESEITDDPIFTGVAF